MNPSKYVVFRLFSLTFTEQSLDWWKDTIHLRRVFHAAEVAGFWDQFRYYGVEDNAKLNKVLSFDSLLAKTASWKVNSYILTNREDEGDCLLELNLRNRMLTIVLKVEGQALDARREVVLDQLIEFACQLHESFQGTALLGPNFHVTLTNVGYPRPRPPRQAPQWSIGSVVDFVSKPYHTQSGDTDALEKLLTAELPDGVVRQQCRDLIVFRWVENLLDDDHVAARRAMQEQWFSNVLDLPIASGYNEMGDRLETLWVPQSHPPLTFYNEMEKQGYKAVVQNPDGSVDNELFADMASWVEAGALPDGLPIDQLHLILPNRESALSVRQRAKTIGVKKVLYTDNEGNLWNPWPPGLWLEQQ